MHKLKTRMFQTNCYSPAPWLWLVILPQSILHYWYYFSTHLNQFTHPEDVGSKHGKTSVRVAGECQLAWCKQNIQNWTYINMIRTH